MLLLLTLLVGLTGLTCASPSPTRLLASRDSDKWLAPRQSASAYPAYTIDMPVRRLIYF